MKRQTEVKKMKQKTADLTRKERYSEMFPVCTFNRPEKMGHRWSWKTT